MKRSITAAALAVGTLIALAAGCRQIVGIGDRTSGDATVPSDAATDGPACGVELGDPGDCNACVQAHCCAAAEACANVPVCKSVEACFAACAGDATCITGCADTYPPGSAVEYAAVESCIASSCATACGLTCGERPTAGPPDSGDGCQRCVVTSLCPQAEACGTSTDCQRILACTDACRTIDCAFGCQAAYDAGAGAFNALASQAPQCAPECLGGQRWGCVGHVTWPAPTTTDNTVSVLLHDPQGGDAGALAGADVKLCSTLGLGLGPGCSLLGEGTSDQSGNVVIPYSADLHLGAVDAYMAVTGAGLTTTFFYWNFPLSEQHAVLGTVETLTQDELAAAFVIAHVTPLPGRGQIGLRAFDCTHAIADGVRFDLTPVDENTTMLYARDGVLVPDGGATDYSGVAFATNVPPGIVAMNVTSVATGLLVSHVTFGVVDGGVDQVFALPTPMAQ